jgi:hypothetical protein
VTREILNPPEIHPPPVIVGVSGLALPAMLIEIDPVVSLA